MEYMRFIADLYQVDSQQVISRARRFAGDVSRFRIGHMKLVESYSHGMKQRLVMAAALLHEPPVLIVDEPMVGLDPEGIKMVRDLFRGTGRQGHHDFHVHAHAVSG